MASSPADPPSPPSPRSTMSSSLLADVSVDSDSEVSSGSELSSALSTPTATAKMHHEPQEQERGKAAAVDQPQHAEPDAFRRSTHRSTAAADSATIAARNQPLPPPAWKQMRIMDPEAILSRAAAAAVQHRKPHPTDPATNGDSHGARAAPAPSAQAAASAPAPSVVAVSPVPAASSIPSLESSSPSWVAFLHSPAPSAPAGVSLSRGIYFPARDNFRLEEAELDAQIAAAQLELMHGNDRLSRAAAAAQQQIAGLPRHHLLPAQGGYAAAVSRRALHSGRSGHSPIRARHPDPTAAARSQSQSKPASRGASPAPSAASSYASLHGTPRSSATVALGAHKRSSSVEPPMRSRSNVAAATASSASHSRAASPASFSTASASAAASGSQSARSSLLTPTASSALRQQPAQRLTSTQPLSASHGSIATLHSPRGDSSAGAVVSAGSTPSIAVPVRGRGRGRSRTQRPTASAANLRSDGNQQQQGATASQQSPARSAFGSSVATGRGSSSASSSAAGTPRSLTPSSSSSRLGSGSSSSGVVGLATARRASPALSNAASRSSTPYTATVSSSSAAAPGVAVSPPRFRARPASAVPSPIDMQALASSLAAAAPAPAAAASASSRSLPLSSAPNTAPTSQGNGHSVLAQPNSSGGSSGGSSGSKAKSARPLSAKKTAERIAREMRQPLMSKKDVNAVSVLDNGSREKTVAASADVAASSAAPADSTAAADSSREARRLKFASNIKTSPIEGEASISAPSPRAEERRPIRSAAMNGVEIAPVAAVSSAASAAASAAPPPAFVSSTTDMFSGLFKFYAHQIDAPSNSPSASASGPGAPPLLSLACFVMNRTEMFQFLIECDLIEHIAALAAGMPGTAASTPTKRQEAIQGLSPPALTLSLDAKKGWFHSVWNTYAEPSAAAAASPLSSALVSPTPQKSLSFAGFTALVTELAWMLWPGALSLDAASVPAADRSHTHTASALIHLLEQWVLPNSSMYNPRSAESSATDAADGAMIPSDGRFRVSPSLALFCLFQLEQILAVHAAFLAVPSVDENAPPPAADPSLSPVDAVRPSVERNYSLLHNLARRFQELQHAESTDEEEEEAELHPLLFPVVSAAAVSGSSFSLATFEHLSHHKRRFDSASGRLLYSPHLSPALFVESLLAAVERQVAASFPAPLSPPSLARDRHKKEKQSACVAQLHSFFDVLCSAL